MREQELRSLPNPVEFRASEKGIGTLVGYGAVFMRLSENLGGFVEQIDPAAFNKTLRDGGPVVARFNHEDNFLLGTTEGGTLRLSVDETGLRYEVDLPDTTAGRDVRVLAERGDLRYSSFAFRTISDSWDESPEGFPMRTLKEVALVDIAPVVSPAYRDTTTGLRCLPRTLVKDIEIVKAMLASGRVKLRDLKETPPQHLAVGVDAERKGPSDTHPLLTARRRLLESGLL
jgi:HK97 family phage prohead protease